MPVYEFDKLVEKHQGNYKAQKFSAELTQLPIVTAKKLYQNDNDFFKNLNATIMPLIAKLLIFV